MFRVLLGSFGISRAKLSEIWDSGIHVEDIWGIFDLFGVYGHFVAFRCIYFKMAGNFKIEERNGLKFGLNQGYR